MESTEQDSLGLAIQYLVAKEQFKEAFKKKHGITSLRKILSEACSQIGEGVKQDGYDITKTVTVRHLLSEKEVSKFTQVTEERLSIHKSKKEK